MILLLVSADSLASASCNDIEVARALERSRAGKARVILVRLRPCDLPRAQFQELEVLSRKGEAVTRWPNRDEAWEDVAHGLREIIGELTGQGGPSPRKVNDPLDDLLVPGTAPLPAEPSPAALLNATYGVVPFFGRAALLQEIHAWCDDAAPVRARLFHGAGGMGKTRLFIEVCARLRRAGWRAGFLPGDVDAQWFEALITAEHPTLAVIDYAESRSDLRDRLKAVARWARKGRDRLRIVLLARNADEWWNDLRGADAEVEPLLDNAPPGALPPLVPSGAERLVAFQEAVARFAIALHKTPPAAPPPRLDDGRYDQVLYLHMAALATVEGLPFTAATLMRSTLDHDQRFWVKRLSPQERSDERRSPPRRKRWPSTASWRRRVPTRSCRT